RAGQAPGPGIPAAAELAAGVEDRVHDLDRRSTLGPVDVDRDASAVVDDADGAVLEDGHIDDGRIARERLVDRVVDDLVDEVVETPWPGRTDVHTGALANRFEALENLDRVCTVFRRLLGLRRFRCHGWIGLLTVVLATLNPIKRRVATGPEAP